MRPERPHILGLVCWVLIIGNMADIYRTMKQMGGAGFALMLERYPYPALDAEIILFGTMAIFVITAILMYEGQGWARYIYLANSIPYLAQGYLGLPQAKASHFPMWTFEAKATFFLASIVIIFLPQVRRYFHPPRYVDE